MNWDDLRYFLAVAREGQMLGAARRMGVSQALLSRHLAKLEEATGSRLLERTTRGCRLTEAGEALLPTAERVEAEMLSGLARLQGSDEITGTVRVGAPDGFGSAFLASRLGRIREAHPSLRIQLVPAPHSFSLSEREADIAIMVGRPDKGRLRVRKLTDYSLGLYAARGYIARHGQPGDLAGLKDHALVGYVGELIYTSELNYAAELWPDWQSSIEVSTAIGQYETVRGGGGIGILHDFMVGDDDGVVRVLPGEGVQRSYWIVWHENLHTAPRVQAVVELLKRIVAAESARFNPLP